MVKLESVLMSYMMYNFDLGYCQGMSDIASVLVQVVQDEDLAFWCFCGFMDRIESNFDVNQYGIKVQLQQLRTLLQFLDPDFSEFLEQKESLNMYFCFRWVLIWFKREFLFHDIKRLWEILWTELPCRNFVLLLACSILLKQRDYIVSNDLNFTDILKFVNDLSEKLDIDEIVGTGNELFKLIEGLKVQGSLSKNIIQILF